jgi:hypothetical protein
LPRSAPKIGGFFDLTGLSGVTSQQLGPAFGNLSKLVLKSFNDTPHPVGKANLLSRDGRATTEVPPPACAIMSFDGQQNSAAVIES